MHANAAVKKLFSLGGRVYIVQNTNCLALYHFNHLHSVKNDRKVLIGSVFTVIFTAGALVYLYSFSCLKKILQNFTVTELSSCNTFVHTGIPQTDFPTL